jgi:hypothetical protein
MERERSIVSCKFIVASKCQRRTSAIFAALEENGEMRTSTISADIVPTHHPNNVHHLLRTPAIPILAELYIYIKGRTTLAEIKGAGSYA